MGRELVEGFGVFRDTVLAADEIFRTLGSSWSALGKISSSNMDLKGSNYSQMN